MERKPYLVCDSYSGDGWKIEESLMMILMDLRRKEEFERKLASLNSQYVNVLVSYKKKKQFNVMDVRLLIRLLELELAQMRIEIILYRMENNYE